MTFPTFTQNADCVCLLVHVLVTKLIVEKNSQ